MKSKSPKKIAIDVEKEIEKLNSCKTEEEVKARFAKILDLNYQTSNRHDLYTETVLFEFKRDKNLAHPKQRATVIAQVVYYLRKLKYGIADKPIPQHFCVIDKDEAFISKSQTWAIFGYSNEEKYDWDLPASSPDPSLIDDILKQKELLSIHVYDLTTPIEFSAFREKILSLL